MLYLCAIIDQHEWIQFNLFLDQSLEGSKDLHVLFVTSINVYVLTDKIWSVFNLKFWKEAISVESHSSEKKEKKKKTEIYSCMVHFQRPLSLKIELF